MPTPSPTPSPSFAPVELPVEVLGGQAESDWQFVGLDGLEINGQDEGIETEDEKAKVREAKFDLDDEEKNVKDKDNEDNVRSANSCCGEGASKVSLLGPNNLTRY